MSSVERLLNLVALLAESRRPLPVEAITGAVPGYEGRSGEASRRMFERDKATLREMGLDLETVPLNPLSGVAPDNTGYRLRTVAPIPDPGLTVEELSALAVSLATVWGDGARTGLEGVDLASAALPPSAEAFLDAIAQRCLVTVEYTSSSATTPRRRKIAPYGLVDRAGSWYVVGSDADDPARQLRRYRIDRMASGIEVGAPGGFARPADVDRDIDVPAHGWDVGSGDPVEVTLRVDPQRRWWVERVTGVEAEAREAGAPTVRLPVRNLDALARWVLTSLGAVEVVAPDAARDAVRSRLAHLAEVLT